MGNNNDLIRVHQSGKGIKYSLKIQIQTPLKFGNLNVETIRN